MPRISSTFEVAHEVRFYQFSAEVIDILFQRLDNTGYAKEGTL